MVKLDGIQKRVASATTVGKRLGLARALFGVTVPQASQYAGLSAAQVQAVEADVRETCTIRELSEAVVHLLRTVYLVNPQWVAFGKVPDTDSVRARLPPKTRQELELDDEVLLIIALLTGDAYDI